MFRMILTHGLIAGVVVGVPLFMMGTLMADNPPTGAVGMAIGYLTMLIAFTTIFVAIKRRRDVELGGVIRFWPALGMGLAIALVGSLCYILAWEAVLAVNGGDFIASMSEQMVAERQAAGASAAEIAELRTQMAEMQRIYTNSFARFAITFVEVFPVGLLVSLLSAALLRNPRFLPLRTA
ncbi:DUF4199 domain-containing protein [Sphingomonas sp. MG17]|uniref:DUF4199 domain-containing protein n=1 Tax=Sphingomonas tagetis TaxID=2949092 RepID=A0A9X2HGA2_9SPHN|nr:DUF4199 domain-containing protein [Sphingomonas tagetis]MCP3728992.1 DUF4199 domain-containing protein [Sphingomonas tagetis]